MNCTRPVVAVDYGIDENGKHRIKILPKRADRNLDYLRSLYGNMLMLLPCGSCINCRTSRAKDWSNRLFLESLEHENNYFITLTYDDYHCPKDLVKAHVQNFIKNIRNSGYSCRYFVAGEYGDRSLRPHYHILLFGLKLIDLEFFSESEGNKFYTSDFIASYWKYGNHLIAEMTPETICYTARYCTKKINNPDYKKEFILMSRRPGIGFHYLETHLQELITDEKMYLGEYGVKGFSRYIKEFIKNRYPAEYEKMSAKNKDDASIRLLHQRLNLRKNEDAIIECEHDISKRREYRSKLREI